MAWLRGPILARKAEIEDILFQPGTKIEVVIATSGAPDLSQPQIDALTEFCSRMNDATAEPCTSSCIKSGSIRSSPCPRALRLTSQLRSGAQIAIKRAPASHLLRDGHGPRGGGLVSRPWRVVVFPEYSGSTRRHRCERANHEDCSPGSQDRRIWARLPGR